LEVGKRGDLVVLDADPLAVERERLKDIRVEMTILGGRIVFPVDHGGTGDGA
jgi:predicted amidohydrolase YtcJ